MSDRNPKDGAGAAAIREVRAQYALPSALYTSEDVLSLERERLFEPAWVAIGRESALSQPGAYIAAEVHGEPIMAVRDRDGRLRVQSNVCRHRMSTLLEGCGTITRIQCPYHGWSYDLDGRLRSAPQMSKERLAAADLRLPQIRHAIWNGWVLVTLNDAAPGVADGLRPLETRLSDYGLEDYVETFREQFVWSTNWKILVENFIESYHLPVCHGETIGRRSDLSELAQDFHSRHYTVHSNLKDESFRLAVAHPANRRLVGDDRRRSTIFAVYPSLLVTVTPGYFWYLSIQPAAVDRVAVIYGGGLAPEFAADPDADALSTEAKRLLDAINEEDRVCTERVYRGVSSRFARPGPLSVMEEPLDGFARYLVDGLTDGEDRFRE